MSPKISYLCSDTLEKTLSGKEWKLKGDRLRCEVNSQVWHSISLNILDTSTYSQIGSSVTDIKATGNLSKAFDVSRWHKYASIWSFNPFTQQAGSSLWLYKCLQWRQCLQNYQNALMWLQNSICILIDWKGPYLAKSENSKVTDSDLN